MNVINYNKTNELSRRIKASDAEAFKEVFERCQQDIFNFLYYKTGNIQTAEDILQDVFASLWENRHTINVKLSLASYLYTIARNLANNHIRHHHVVIKFQQQQKSAHAENHVPSPQVLFEEQELHDSILKAAEKLSAMQRTVFMMSRFDQLSNKEIAERLGISVKTVETHIGRALKTISSSIKPFL